MDFLLKFLVFVDGMELEIYKKTVFQFKEIVYLKRKWEVKINGN